MMPLQRFWFRTCIAGSGGHAARKNVAYYKRSPGAFSYAESGNRSIYRQDDLKLGSLTRLACELDVPAMTVDDGFG